MLAINRGDGKAVDTPRGAVTITGLSLDVLFPVLHGPYGEDGTVQGLIELAGMPYVGAGVLASAAGMDKAIAKVLFASRGLRVGPYEVVLRREWIENPKAVAARLLDSLGLPLFVKPANLGSSVGISKVKDPSALAGAMDLAAEFDRKVVVEAAIPDAREIECAVLGNDAPEASTPGEIVPSREFYDYEAKYLDEGSKSIIPAELEPAQAETIRRQAIEAFRAIDCSGMARVDFLLSRIDGAIYINEINTIPGFTTISMYSKMWEASGVPYPALLDRLISLALERHAEKQQLRTTIT
jgi:D-alanine-D-alanine ligase